MSGVRVFILTGDHSGDTHAGKVALALRALSPDIEIAGVGGERLQAAGATLLADQSKMNRIGFGALFSAPYHWLLKRKILAFLKTFKPNAVLLIDYGMFNLVVAKALKTLKIQVYYFIPPQVWASRRGRLKKIKASVDHVFCIFPFEAELYQSENIPVTYVGHPLIGELSPPADRYDFCTGNRLDPQKPIVGIFAGSRTVEIDYLLPPIVDSLARIARTVPGVQFVFARAASIPAEIFSQKLKNQLHALPVENSPRDAGYSVHVVSDQNHALMSVADALIAKSGTTTLEAALYNTPMIIIYKGSPILYQVAKRVIYLPFIGLPNILSGEKTALVPELLQHEANGRQIAETLTPLLNETSEDRARQKVGFAGLFAKLDAGNTAENVALALLKGIEIHQKK